MKNIVRNITLTLLGVSAVVCATFIAGARVNTTRSFPIGLYWTVPNAPIEKGALVIFCPPRTGLFDEAKRRGYIDIGFCDGGYGNLIKKVVATANDQSRFTSSGVFVNDIAIPNSKPISKDPYQRLLPALIGTITLSADEVLLMSDYSATSFDARYFGPIKRTYIKNVIRPIITW